MLHASEVVLLGWRGAVPWPSKHRGGSFPPSRSPPEPPILPASLVALLSGPPSLPSRGHVTRRPVPLPPTLRLITIDLLLPYGPHTPGPSRFFPTGDNPPTNPLGSFNGSVLRTFEPRGQRIKVVPTTVLFCFLPSVLDAVGWALFVWEGGGGVGGVWGYRWRRWRVALP